MSRPNGSDPLSDSWPYPFSRDEWDQVPPAVQDYLRALEQRLDRLEAILNRDSRNSNQPPSSDSPYRAKGSRKKKAKRKKAGTKKGHRGHCAVRLEPTETVPLYPEPCSCGGTDWVDPEPFYTHQRVELPEVLIEVVHFILHQARCTQCGEVVKAELPLAEQTGYGPRFTAFVCMLLGVIGTSRRDVQQFLGSVFGVPVALGTLQKIVDRGSDAIEPHYDAIGERARSNEVNYIDETTWRNQGALRWLWVMGSTVAAYFKILPGRSQRDFAALIGLWRGILVSDDYGVYRNWVNLRQACLAHLIRKAERLAESKNTELAGFGRRVRGELQRMCQWAHAPPSVGQWGAHYMRLVGLINAHRDRPDDAGRLARALERQLDHLWTFLEVNAVDPTNNLAERLLRFLVKRRKATGGSQSQKGERWMERIASLRETCRIRGQRAYPILVHAIQSHFEGRDPDLSWLITP